MITVLQFFEAHGKSLGLNLIAGREGTRRRIIKPEVSRPGLSLTGYLKGFPRERLLVFGKHEIEYFRNLDASVRLERLKAIFAMAPPGVILGRSVKPPRDMVQLCEAGKIPLFRSPVPSAELISRITLLLMEEFSPTVTLHGTLVEVFGVGVLIQGESSVGKSEAALGLIERGHRLISDDVVRVKKKEDSVLVGSGPELTRHLMEIRGIGIINVAHLYGAVCVRPDKGLELIVKLEEWDDGHFYDRVGLDEKFLDILGVSVPFHLLPVKPGRDVVLLLETIALNHRLKDMGYHSAREFNAKLLEAISKRQKRKVLA